MKMRSKMKQNKVIYPSESKLSKYGPAMTIPKHSQIPTGRIFITAVLKYYLYCACAAVNNVNLVPGAITAWLSISAY